MLLFLLNILFWSVVYIVDAFADSQISKIINLAVRQDSYLTNIYSAAWHNSRLIYYAFFHILFSYLVYALSDNLILSIAQLLLSLEIKTVVRGTALSLFLNIPLFEFSSNGKWDWFDNLLISFQKKIRIHPVILIYFQFVLFILIYIEFFMQLRIFHYSF